MRQILSVLVLLASTVAASGRAADVHTLDVDEHQGHYTIVYDVVLYAPREKIYAAIVDPAQWPRLSRVVKSTKVLGTLSDGGRRVSVTFHDCILIFCQTVHKNEALHSGADGRIETLAFPEQSDFSYARESWRISSEDQHTRIHYKAEMTPSFFIPPLIGSYIFKAKIRSLLLHVTSNLEALAED